MDFRQIIECKKNTNLNILLGTLSFKWPTCFDIGVGKKEIHFWCHPVQYLFSHANFDWFLAFTFKLC